VLYLAGFYKRFDDAFRFVILTTEANDSVAAFHDRMPVILEKDYLAVWTANTAAALEYLHSTMPGLTAVGC
jgi:putative SOS response-associated peptidase YedK